MEMMAFLERTFFERPAAEVARDLLGRDLVHGEKVARIVEVEAYLGVGDAAAHSARGLTQAVAALKDGPGTIYIHAMRQYVGMDLVALGGSLLIRAAEPLVGIDGDERAASGPGKLCRALGIGRELQGMNVTDEGCVLRVGVGREVLADEVAVGVRVGINRAVDLPLRFYLRGNEFVSKGARAPRGW